MLGDITDLAPSGVPGFSDASDVSMGSTHDALRWVLFRLGFGRSADIIDGLLRVSSDRFGSHRREARPPRRMND
jgi:hypothetical protein